MLQVASQIFSIHPDKVKIHSTSTFRIANTSPSAASATADLNGKAVQMACTEILKRLKARAAERLCASIDDVEIKNDFVWLNEKKTEISWENIVLDTYFNRISLSEHAHYALRCAPR